MLKGAYRSKTFIQASFWLSAIAVGGFAVLFDRIVAHAQHWYFLAFAKHKIWMTAATPFLFVLATALVVFIAPNAKGSGIPQALKAMLMSLGSYHIAMKSGLISLRTALVKVLSAAIGILAGASIGREGPTVQISTAIFAFIGSRTKKVFPHVDFHSYLVAGSAAGVAAAFNTPLAGISFALEEMAEGTFAQIKQSVMVSVILAGITTQTLVGNYLYFGHPSLTLPEVKDVIPALTIGLVGGILGGLFAKFLAYPILSPSHRRWWVQAFLCGAICAAINFALNAQTAGTGYEITRSFMDSSQPTFHPLFFVGKLFATVFSFLSGMAGGIFSPSLSIGAGMGATVAQFAGFEQIKFCALLGMVAFFTGAVQAPLTAVIIVMEMTDIHELILPLMIAAFVAQGMSKLLMPTSLYRHLAKSYQVNGGDPILRFSMRKHVLK